jgi:hypothetical protein
VTRVFKSPFSEKGLRVLAVGAGAYPHAKSGTQDLPVLHDLTSVEPSVMSFVQRLLKEWRSELAMDLISVDLLLSDPDHPDGMAWPGFGVSGEIEQGTPIELSTFTNFEKALAETLYNTSGEDGLLLFLCGHGFFRASRYFVLSDFGKRPSNPWSEVIDLDALGLGLRQEPPRTQWLFWDCCADIPNGVLDPLGNIGNPVIQPKASRISVATTRYGALSRFGISSAALGEQAFGIPGASSRFTEMLLEAIQSAGAVRAIGGVWWVDHLGIIEAMQTYAQRHPELEDSSLYSFATPFSSDSPQRIPFRRLSASPSSILIAKSVPQRRALKDAEVRIEIDGSPGAEPVYKQNPPRPKSAIIRVPVPPLQHYKITAIFENGEGQRQCQVRSCFAYLPLAEAVEFEVP